MKKLIAFSDLHYNSPNGHAWDGDLEFGDDIIHCGDIWEFKNIPYNKVKDYIQDFKKYMARCRTTNTLTVASNHGVSVERDYNGEYALVKTFNDKKILVVHGHRLYYGLKKYSKWENKKPGIGFWKRMWIASKNGNYKESSPKLPPIKVLDEAARLAKINSCTHVIWGHSHHTFRGVHRDVEMINVGRGRSEIDIF